MHWSYEPFGSRCWAPDFIRCHSKAYNSTEDRATEMIMEKIKEQVSVLLGYKSELSICAEEEVK